MSSITKDTHTATLSVCFLQLDVWQRCTGYQRGGRDKPGHIQVKRASGDRLQAIASMLEFSPPNIPVQPNTRELPKRDLFSKKFTVWALNVHSKTTISQLLQAGKDDGVFLNLPRFKVIVNKDSESERRLILLSPNIFTPEDTEVDILEAVKGFPKFSATIAELDSSCESKSISPSKFERHTFSLGWDYWTAEQLLRALLPEGLEVPVSFETIGHIAHMNLRENILPFRYIVGKVILDKTSGLRTVVNKLDSIETVFRTFDMEVLAGVDDLSTLVSESGCTFEFDFREVYWNSRLQSEHLRLVETYIRQQNILCDGCAGIGPFSVPAAKNKNVVVLANDLNPASYKYLIRNIKRNKVSDLVRAYNMDGLDFVSMSASNLAALTSPDGTWFAVQKKLLMNEGSCGLKTTRVSRKRIRHVKDDCNDCKTDPVTTNEELEAQKHAEVAKKAEKIRVHYVFNLPGHARNFLVQFSRTTFPVGFEVYVHVYTFHRPEYEPVPELRRNIWKALYFAPDGGSLDVKQDISPCPWVSLDGYSNSLGKQHCDIRMDEARVWRVRNVAPGKEMVCVSFVLPDRL